MKKKTIVQRYFEFWEGVYMKGEIEKDILMNSSVYMFKFENKYVIYNFVKGFIIEIPKNIYEIVEKYQKEEILEEEEKKVIDALMKAGLLTGKVEFAEKDYAKCNIAYLTFAPIYGCNFRCTYCFAQYGTNYSGKPKKFTEERLKKTLDFFFYRAYPQMEQYRIDFVSGGEPLLEFETVKKTIKYVKEYSRKTEKNVSIWLCTNGALLTEQICQYLSENNVSIGVSLDGIKSKHDRNRVDINGEGTYDSVVQNIIKLQENPKLSKKFKDIWGLAVASNDNSDFVEIITEYRRLGIKNGQIRLVRDGKNLDWQKIIASYNALYVFLYENFCNGDLIYLNMILNDNDQFGKVLKRILLDDLIIKRCNAGVNKMTICPDGTIYPCDSFVGKVDFSMGEMESNEIKRSILMDVNVNNCDKCKECDIRYLCGGDCYYNALLINGSVWNADKEYCEIQRHIIESCIMLRYKMQQKDRNLLEKLIKGVRLKNEYSKYYG